MSLSTQRRDPLTSPWLADRNTAGLPLPCVLTINGGSSTLRFALFRPGQPPRLLMRGKIERIGHRARWIVTGADGQAREEFDIAAGDTGAAADYLLKWLDAQSALIAIDVVAHRVVHGMARVEPARVTPELVEELRRIMAFDPEHLPFEIALIEAFEKRHPALPQIACFDTAFHRDMPMVAKRLPLPRRYHAMGIERYGFHGLSYAYLMEELGRLGDPAATRGRIILAHLGNGASLAAVRDGRGIDTTMGFTPTGGTMMSSRSGDLDPGVGFYLAQTENMGAAQFQRMVNHESGLLGVSETSADMRDLLARVDDTRAAEAVAMFCYHVRKWIGALTAALGGLDTLVFAGGIGENAPPIRERICADLSFLGLELDPAHNANSAGVISTPGSRVRVRVIHTDEESMLAQSALRFPKRTE